MRIVFICGSFEQAKDGVGDYVRCLSEELIHRGHSVLIIALNDQYVDQITYYSQFDDRQKVITLRIPSNMSWQERIAKSKNCIADFDSHWISLQFVPFSFHSKGLHFYFHSLLYELGKGKKWHIMFHELWVGMNKEAQLKLKVWGGVQRILIKALIKKIKPEIIHTQTTLYQNQLNKLGFKAKYLPLFTNIVKSLDKCNMNKSGKNISIVHFGSIHPLNNFEDFANEVISFKNKYSYSVTLKVIGRCSDEKFRWQRFFSAAGIDTELMNEQPPDVISKVLSNSSLGISTTPLAQIEKSGSVAAMLAHGLKVVCISKPWTIKNMNSRKLLNGVFEYKKGNFEIIYQKEQQDLNVNDVSSIASQLVSSLDQVI